MKRLFEYKQRATPKRANILKKKQKKNWRKILERYRYRIGNKIVLEGGI